MRIISILLKVGKAVYNKAKQIGKKVAVFAKKVGKGALKGLKKVGKFSVKFAQSPIGQMLIQGGLESVSYTHLTLPTNREV